MVIVRNERSTAPEPLADGGVWHEFIPYIHSGSASMPSQIIREAPDVEKEGKPVQAQAQSDTEPFDAASGSLRDLKKASAELKAKIDEAKRQHDMPLDSALGDPNLEERAADGRFDRPDEEDEE
jgi:hypothetical protein